ncbi:tyrosine-type recombinase/integrase [Eubacteriales bacterium OttesenSCG-928-K08]|nr:tyrosine-type recombinase/integrase [Eubacteriales bacterium OttesenSCG-928-K08]
MRKNEAKWVESRQRWQINVQVDGERKTFTSTVTGTKGKVAAEKAADKWVETRHTKDVRFEKLWGVFLEEVEKTTGTANYKKHESIGRLWLLPEVGHRKLSKITNEHWQNCVNAAYEKGLSKKTCSNIRASITAVYGFAKKRRAPLDRPEDIAIPKQAPVGERNILQPDDIKKLFANDTILHRGGQVPCFFIHAWRFIVLTGLRRGELAGLQKGDIKDRVLYVRRSVNSENEITGGKNDNAKRYIVLSERQKLVLQEQADLLKRNGIVTTWLFPGRDGRMVSPNRIYDNWCTFRKQYDIKASIHEMRHTTVSVAMADVPEQLLKRMVGHSKSMDTFGVYGHDVKGEMQRASDLLDEVFSRIIDDD